MKRKVHSPVIYLMCLQRYAKKEVLEVIRNTRETIQFLRSQLSHENKHASEDSGEQQEIRGYYITSFNKTHNINRLIIWYTFYYTAF